MRHQNAPIPHRTLKLRVSEMFEVRRYKYATVRTDSCFSTKYSSQVNSYQHESELFYRRGIVRIRDCIRSGC